MKEAVSAVLASSENDPDAALWATDELIEKLPVPKKEPEKLEALIILPDKKLEPPDPLINREPVKFNICVKEFKLLAEVAKLDVLASSLKLELLANSEKLELLLKSEKLEVLLKSEYEPDLDVSEKLELLANSLKEDEFMLPLNDPVNEPLPLDAKALFAKLEDWANNTKLAVLANDALVIEPCKKLAVAA